MRPLIAAAVAFCLALPGFAPARADDDPDLIFKKTTVWKMLSPDAKLATYAIDDPNVTGVACHFTLPEKGGWLGWAGLSEELSEVSLSCRQTGPVAIKAKFEQGAEVHRESRSIFFKKARIVRGCDKTRNTLVYLMYTDKLIDGSPQNSTSTVPIMPWGATTDVARCADFVTD